MNTETSEVKGPIILAPAGNRASFLAAIAAGADAVYCGLKLFSARMEADNFSIEELSLLARFARSRGVKVYVTLNSLLKPTEIEKAGRLVDKLRRYVKPDALIVQDLAMVKISRQAGFKGELHLSTLANLSSPSGLAAGLESLGINRVVVPREFNIDEIKTMASSCPDGVDLELFIHGALCYAVSGRCYWSSFLGGKSGLRGRCVQPCRRIYENKGQRNRFFSCMDLSLDVLAKVLKEVPEISTWKIEGRKKGPHYVFYTVTAYKMLRDQGHDPAMKRGALKCLEQALGRPATHYNILPQRPQLPVRTDTLTGSGLLVGRIKDGRKKPWFSPRVPLMSGDLLRLGYEDEPGHAIVRVGRSVPKRGRFDIKQVKGKKTNPDAPVFLLDRREKELSKMIDDLEQEVAKFDPPQVEASTFSIKNGNGRQRSKQNVRHKSRKIVDLNVYRMPGRGAAQGETGLWISKNSINRLSGGMFGRCWWWLPPILWPEEENGLRQVIKSALKKGSTSFVLNAPWQISLFDDPSSLNLWAGPFCNQSNAFSIDVLSSMGFSGVIVSPELNSDDYVALGEQSPLPLGIVTYGNWPFCISRTLAEDMDSEHEFASPKGEKGWVLKHGSDFWLYPNWFHDIREKKDILQRAGYKMMVHLNEPVPRHIDFKKRKGMWNWDLKLL